MGIIFIIIKIYLVCHYNLNKKYSKIKYYGGLKNGTICLLYPNCLSDVYVNFGTYSRKIRYYLGSLRTIFIQRYFN